MLPAKFLVETLVIGAAVFFPMALMDPPAIVIGAIILAGVLVHDNRLVVKPQMEPLL